MIRFWMLVILFACIIGSEAEARGRHRVMRYHGVMRYQGSSWQSRPSAGYTTSTTQAVHSTSSQSTSQQVIQTVSLSSSSSSGSGSSTVQVHPLQAWAEEEARMMASRGTCGHIRPAPPGCFVGVGCGMTCMGSGHLVAEASYQGKMVRVWQR